MRFLRTRLTARLVFAFIAFMDVVIIALGSLAFVNARSSLVDSVYSRLDAVSTLKEDALDRWLDDRQNEVLSVSLTAGVDRSLSDLAGNPEDSALYKTRHRELTTLLIAEAENLPSFDEIFLLSPVGGKILVSTNPDNEGDYRVSDGYYAQGRIAAHIQKVYTSPQTGKPTMTIAAPVFDSGGSLVGVIAAHLDLNQLDSIILQRAGLGETGESYLVDRFNNFMSPARFGEREFPRGVHTVGIDAAMNGVDGKALYLNYDNRPIVGAYDWLDKWDMALITEVSQNEALEPARRLGFTVIFTGILVALVMSGGAYLVGSQITRPIIAISDAASRIAAGEMNVEIPVSTEDETSVLARSFNLMTRRLRETLSGLEQRVMERTADLETARLTSERRAEQLLAIGEISRNINSEQRLDRLLPMIANLVSERFGYYHTGIFLLDESRHFAVLQAANSAGGRTMLANGHKLEVGENSIVGFVTIAGQPRIALDVGQDAVFFNNPHLPNTRSEMALPLSLGGRIIGALDAQSDQPGAFTQNDAGLLGILSDQIAIAIENARLLEQAQAALNEARSLYRSDLREAWLKFTPGGETVGYQYGLSGGKKLTEPLETDEIKQAMFRGEALVFHADGKTGEPTLVTPIKLREQIVGVMRIEAPFRDRPWTAAEINLAETVAERLSLALENARLLEESQRQAIKEQTIGEITGKIGSTINLENVLLTAVEELGRNIPGSEVTIKLKQDDRNDGSH
jgi:GAF domain-containing protein/HAMP domain-containing protein